MIGASGFEPTTSNPTIKQYRAEYAKADIFCQKVQDFIREAGIPAMNELRNAGHHFLKSVDDNGKMINPNELTRAINHAKRACYEAGEAGILIALDEIHAFKEDFRGIRISQAVPGFVEMMAKASEARDTITQSRANEEDKTRDHQARMDAFDELRGICRILEAARDECQALVSEAVTASRRFYIGLVVTIALAVIGWAYFTGS